MFKVGALLKILDGNELGHCSRSLTEMNLVVGGLMGLKVMGWVGWKVSWDRAWISNGYQTGELPVDGSEEGFQMHFKWTFKPNQDIRNTFEMSL
jgi:hypothetical protein